MLFNQPKNYRGKIPIELYVKLQNAFPQKDGETDSNWLKAMQANPALYQLMFGTAQFKNELIQGVKWRDAIAKMADAGATRESKRVAWRPAQRYMDDERARIEGLGKDQATFAREAYQQLLAQFEAPTPPNGSVFWNGINELALVKKIDKWNSDGEIFEATTAARYVNKKFVWQPGAFANYFTDVSGKLGLAARGHVTAVCRCGLRSDSILTTTELPEMFNQMDEQIKARQEPTITDITIVVIQPKLWPYQEHATYTNKDLVNISIVSPLPGQRISGRDTCIVDRQLELKSHFLNYYWAARGPRAESPAAGRIKEDLRSLITW